MTTPRTPRILPHTERLSHGGMLLSRETIRHVVWLEKGAERWQAQVTLSLSDDVSVPLTCDVADYAAGERWAEQLRHLLERHVTADVLVKGKGDTPS